MNTKEYERKLKAWEAEGYDVSELREKWFPVKKRHLARWLSIGVTICIVIAAVIIWQAAQTPPPTPTPAPAPAPASPAPTPAPVSAQIPESNKYFFSGYVRESGTNAPIADARVTVIDYNSLNGPWIENGKASTDSEGHYVVSARSSGTYAVQVQAKGYATEWYDSTYAKDSATPLSLTDPGERSNVNFILEPGGSISGRVIADASLDIIPDLHIFATDYGTNEWIAGTSTRADGTYTLSGLPAGTYRVRAMPSNDNLPYAGEYYDNTYDYDEAQRVTVNTGQDTPGINFSLAPGGTISGVIRSADGSATLANVSVECRRPTDSGGAWFGATTDSEGKYTIGGLPYGDHVVRSPSGGRWGSGDSNYFTEYYNNKSREEQAELVTVASDANPSNINFTLSAGGSISGKVIADASLDSIANLHVFAEDYTTGEWLAGTNTRADGTYTLGGLPAGVYRVRAAPSNDDLPYADEYYDNTSERNEARPVTVTAGQDTPGINFSLFSLERGGSISGKVIADASLDGIANLNVNATDYTTGEGMAGTQTRADGTYTLSGLPAGTYRVRAMPSNNILPYANEYYDNVYGYDEAQRVTVTTGHDTTGINFSLAAGGTISGVLRNADGSATLASVSVECRRPIDSGGAWFGATADSEGEYTIGGLPYGDYILRSPGSGRWGTGDTNYIMEYFNDKSRMEQAELVTVNSGVNPSDVNFTLSSGGGSISGKVIADASLDSIANLHVFAEDYTTGEWLAGTNTRADGTYTLGGLPAGVYRVRAAPSNDDLPYADEYYDNTSERNKAQQVKVTAGQDTPGINFSLAAALR